MLALGIPSISSISLVPVPIQSGAVDHEKATEENILTAH